MTTPVERLNAALFGVGLSLLTLLASAPAAAAQSGVYTAAQAESGRTLYTDRCASCHGDELSEGSAPPLAGPTFRRTWSRTNVTVDDLLYIMTASMPPQRTGELSQGQYVSILAYIISQNGLAAGSTALTADADQLRTLNLLSDEDRAAGTAVAFIEGTRATQAKPTRVASVLTSVRTSNILGTLKSPSVAT